MKDKTGLVIGLMIGLFGLYKIDRILCLGLNYFGKYVFFGLFNIFALYGFWFCYKKFKGVWKNLAPILYSFIFLIAGLSI